MTPAGLSFDPAPCEGAFLMERDAARWAHLESDPAAGASLLWYRFARPTITVGRLQDPALAFDPEALERDEIPVVRRPTGGRAVFHVEEWTYGAVVPADHPFLGGSLRASCHALVALIARALRDAYAIPVGVGGAGGAGTVLGPGTAFGAGAAGVPALGFACFARAYGHEATVAGRKLMGSAQHRGRRAYLQQGCLLVGPGHERLARYARPHEEATGERDLASRTTTLREILGAHPDPARFREAIAKVWAEATGLPASARVRASSPSTLAPPLDVFRQRF